MRLLRRIDLPTSNCPPPPSPPPPFLPLPPPYPPPPPASVPELVETLQRPPISPSALVVAPVRLRDGQPTPRPGARLRQYHFSGDATGCTIRVARSPGRAPGDAGAATSEEGSVAPLTRFFTTSAGCASPTRRSGRGRRWCPSPPGSATSNCLGHPGVPRLLRVAGPRLHRRPLRPVRVRALGSRPDRLRPRRGRSRPRRAGRSPAAAAFRPPRRLHRRARRGAVRRGPAATRVAPDALRHLAQPGRTSWARRCAR